MSDTTFTINKEKLEVSTERLFEASPERLWRAVTEPDQIVQWWGPHGMKTTIDKMDVTVGGQWRIIHTEPGGQEHGFNGEFQEVDEPHKIVRTFTYEPVPGHVLTETLTLEPTGDGKTKLTATAKYASLEDLEGMVGMGMEKGQRESFDRLGTLVKS